MKEDIARGWAAYLRTPGLKQAKGHLMKADGSACCLGHLCEYLGVEKKLVRAGGVYEFFEEATSSLPRSVKKEAGMYSPLGRHRDGNFLVGGAVCSTLAEVNDKSGLTLPEIADLIEANWERL